MKMSDRHSEVGKRVDYNERKRDGMNDSRSR